MVEIRRLVPDDHDKLIGLWEEAGLSHRPHGRDSKENIAKYVEHSGDLALGAFDGDELVGAVIGTFDGRKGHINRLAVHPSNQRSGLAMDLIDRCEKALKARGAEVISVLIELPNHRSEELFKKAGYVKHDDITYFSKRDRPDA